MPTQSSCRIPILSNWYSWKHPYGGFGLSDDSETGTQYNAINSALSGLAAVPGSTNGEPKAYLQYLLFDKNYNYIAPLEGEYSYKKITTAANGNHENLSLDVIIPQDGYIYIYIESVYKVGIISLN